jgi:hypothetical protein
VFHNNELKRIYKYFLSSLFCILTFIDDMLDFTYIDFFKRSLKH